MALPGTSSGRVVPAAGAFYLWALAAQNEKEVRLLPGKKHGPAIKKPKTYEALKKKGMSKSRAARISNAQAKKSS